MALYDLVATVPVGDGVQSIAVNPAGTIAYVQSWNNVAAGYTGSSSLSIVSTATNTVTTNIPSSPSNLGPQGIALNPAGTRLFVTNMRQTNPFQPSVFDTSDFSNLIPYFGGFAAATHSVAVNPAGTKAYFTVYRTNSDDVYTMNTADYTQLLNINVGSGVSLPTGIAINPAGTRVYVACSAGAGGNRLSVIDTATDTQITTITGLSGPRYVAVSPSGTRVYVTNDNNSVSVINADTNTITATVTVGSDAQGVVVNPSGTKVFVANQGSSTVSVIDTSTNTVVQTINSMTGAKALAVNPAGTRLYVGRGTIVEYGYNATTTLGSMRVVDIAEPKSGFFAMF